MKFKPEESANFIAFFDTIKDRIEAMPGIVSVSGLQCLKAMLPLTLV